jgi:hypothetical protein
MFELRLAFNIRVCKGYKNIHHERQSNALSGGSPQWLIQMV